MFLTKKGQRKAAILTVCYAILGCICIVLGIVELALQMELQLSPSSPSPSLYIGVAVLLLCPLVYISMRYIEGVSKLTSLGTKLIYKELRPAEFIKQYEALKNDPNLIIKKPDFTTLALLAVAYSSLNDQECLAVADELIAVSSEKKKPLAKLTKASYLYDCGMIEEAEALFSEVQQAKQDATCKYVADVLLKSDRAKAIGDYKTVECFTLQRISQTFPKPANLTKLLYHFNLGDVYEKMNEPSKAIPYYQYCADHGGETAIKDSAKEALQRLQ